MFGRRGFLRLFGCRVLTLTKSDRELSRQESQLHWGHSLEKCCIIVPWGFDLGYSLADQLKVIRRTKLYDLFTAAPLIAWFLFSLAQLLPSVGLQIALVKLFIQTDPSFLPASLILSLTSKVCTLVFLALMVVMFAVRHVPERFARGFYPRFAAVAGTFIGVGIVWLPPQELSPGLSLASVLLIIGGTAFEIYAAIVLGRSISVLPEARRLVISGPYSFIRHPLYLGEMFAIAGIALLYLSPWAVLLAGLQCAFQFQRMKNEERVLIEAFPDYRDYMARTARLVPGLY